MWEFKLLDPRDIVPGVNLRAADQEHVEHIANGFLAIGQLHACHADKREGVVTLWAGFHRHSAGLLSVAHDESFRLKVEVCLHVLTAAEILELQLNDNLQLSMSPVEEARGIEVFSATWETLYGARPSDRQLAARIGRSRGKVRDARRFVSLAPMVQQMVREGALPYSVAVELNAVAMEKQPQLAARAVVYNLSAKRLRGYIERLSDDTPTLFTGQIAVDLERENHRLAVRNALDRQAKQAAGYFRRVVLLGRRFTKESDRLEMTGAVRDILATLIWASGEFLVDIRDIDVSLADELVETVKGLKEIV